MSVRNEPPADKEGGTPRNERLPQRWVTILAVASAFAVVTGFLVSAVVAVPVWLGTVGLLHQIME